MLLAEVIILSAAKEADHTRWIPVCVWSRRGHWTESDTVCRRTVQRTPRWWGELLLVLRHGSTHRGRSRQTHITNIAVTLVVTIMCVGKLWPVGHMGPLATCINYADLNNSMLRMCGHVSTGFLAVTSYSCKVNTMVFVILLQVRIVYFLNTGR